MVCLGDEERSFCHFWACIQVLHFGLFCWPWWPLHFFWGILPTVVDIMVKQEMARVNVNILRLSELKWTGMGEFNSDDHYIYYCGQESLRRNGIAIVVNKSPKCSSWMQSQKWQNDLCSFPRRTIQYQLSKSMPQPVTLKKLKLNGFMKTYKNF